MRLCLVSKIYGFDPALDRCRLVDGAPGTESVEAGLRRLTDSLWGWRLRVRAAPWHVARRGVPSSREDVG